jgi:CDP-diacylglycerol--glycerol-3-phosphate 3-phosphatidyltransferase
MNWPNALSLLRVALLPFIVLALRNGADELLLPLMALAAATDYFDGFLARRTSQVTDRGKVLDPLADKICVNTMAAALWLWRGFPGWAAIMILVRDLLILLGGLLILKKRKAVPVSNWPGKIAVTVMAATIIFYAMNWQPWGRYLLYGSAVMLVVSGILYLKILTSPQPLS